jgi:hypothetical protein
MDRLMLNEITRGDVEWVLAMLPDDVDPSEDLVRAIAESLLVKKRAEPSDLSDAIQVVRRVVAARQLPED